MFRLTNFIKEILHLISHLHRICARWLVRLIIIITILQKNKGKKKERESPQIKTITTYSYIKQLIKNKKWQRIKINDSTVITYMRRNASWVTLVLSFHMTIWFYICLYSFNGKGIWNFWTLLWRNKHTAESSEISGIYFKLMFVGISARLSSFSFSVSLPFSVCVWVCVYTYIL